MTKVKTVACSIESIHLIAIICCEAVKPSILLCTLASFNLPSVDHGNLVKLLCCAVEKHLIITAAF